MGLIYGLWRWREVLHHRKAIEAVKADIESGHYGLAVKALDALLTRSPDSDEAAYLLGQCEQSRGRSQAAERAWSRIPPDSRFAPQAILGRMLSHVELGRLAEAERIVNDALEDPRIDGSSLPILLGPIYCQQGRLGETLRLIENRWEALNRSGEGASEPAIDLVRAHIDLRREPVPTEVIRAALDRAGQLAPDDDRVWLGKANLAIRLGSFDEAELWLDACSRRRPTDAVVWRSRLDWAVATGRVGEAKEAVEHLPSEEWNPEASYRLIAWLAQRRGDTTSEVRALEHLADAAPADLNVLDRLTRLVAREGQQARVEELRRKRAELQQLETRRLLLFRRNQPLRDAAEMARLAERLGYGFEAKGFLTVALDVEPERVDLRKDLDRHKDRERIADQQRGTLAADLAREFSTSEAPHRTPRDEGR